MQEMWWLNLSASIACRTAPPIVVPPDTRGCRARSISAQSVFVWSKRAPRHRSVALAFELGAYTGTFIRCNVAERLFVVLHCELLDTFGTSGYM
jgi:hypothetical protein